MSNVVYEAAVYTRTVSYTNFKGETKEVELFFALDPIQLMRVMATVPNPKKSRSKSPVQAAADEEGLTHEQQLKFLVDLASKAAGFPSDDGESFEPFPDFAESIAGKAFITKLASSDGDREEFARMVILDPFTAFVNYAEADENNSRDEIKQFREMLASMERIFASKATAGETYEDRRARLEAELAQLPGGDA